MLNIILRQISSKSFIYQVFLIFFNGGYKLVSESLLAKAWAAEDDPRSKPSLNPKFVGSIGRCISDDKEWWPMSSWTMKEGSKLKSHPSPLGVVSIESLEVEAPALLKAY